MQMTSPPNCQPSLTIPAWANWRICFGWLPLALLPVTVLAVGQQWPKWVFMWMIAFAIFIGCKWLTWWQVRNEKGFAGWRSAAYLLAWPGMDPKPFLPCQTLKSPFNLTAWIGVVAKVVVGLILLFGFARAIPSDYPLIRGWIGMIGLTTALHFGLFHLLALTWQAVGIHTEPLMQSPILSTSMSEFWGRRWNRAFRDLSQTFIFRPLRRTWGPTLAMMTVFLTSGLVHELVISIPAGAGYGLPTLFFVVQGMGILLERSSIGEALGLRQGLPGRLFTAACTIGPVFWLFHPNFVVDVFLPFMCAIGAL